MPQLTVKGMKIDELCKISKELTDKLEIAANCERKHIKIEYCQTEYIKDGSIVEPFPKVEVLWFGRSQEVQDNVAKIITDMIKEFGYKHVQVTFNVFEATKFYENGEHY